MQKAVLIFGLCRHKISIECFKGNYAVLSDVWIMSYLRVLVLIFWPKKWARVSFSSFFACWFFPKCTTVLSQKDLWASFQAWSWMCSPRSQSLHLKGKHGADGGKDISWYFPVDCKWSSLSKWSSCSATCGQGTRSKQIKYDPQKHGGAPCDFPAGQKLQVDGSGKASLREDCNVKKCPGGWFFCWDSYFV